MSVRGAPTAWVDLLERMLPQLIELVIDAWDGLERPFPDTREDAITVDLCRALRRNRTARELPFLIGTQEVELEPEAGQVPGRLDIAFRPTGLESPPDERVYFCLECKRLQAIVGGTRRSGASEYVVYGMARFVTGQYAALVRHGGMLGYVLDGDVEGSIRRVAENVKRRSDELRMVAPAELQRSTIAGHLEHVRESHHNRKQGEVFRIHHAFVPAE